MRRLATQGVNPCPLSLYLVGSGPGWQEGVVHLPEGTEMVMPGDNVSMEVELIAPIAMDEGLRFAIREGGRTVGAGVVAGIIQ